MTKCVQQLPVIILRKDAERQGKGRELWVNRRKTVTPTLINIDDEIRELGHKSDRHPTLAGEQLLHKGFLLGAEAVDGFVMVGDLSVVILKNRGNLGLFLSTRQRN